MGRRRSNAPRRGSLAYLPRKRANRPIGRIRHWPDVTLDAPGMLGFSGYKVGMSYVYLINNVQESPTFGQEVICPVTIVETPPVFVAGFRGYVKSVDGLKTLSETWSTIFPKNVERAIVKPLTRPHSPDAVKKSLSRIAEFRAILLTQPHLANVPQKKPEIFEVKVNGGSIEDQFTYLYELLGKTVNISDVFTEGQYIDVIAITKGKGFQGPVKRWGVKKRPHKSRKTVRGVATLGPWSPHYVMYTVPRAGQMGFHQRTDRNKRILKINQNGEELNPQGGFLHYGVVKSANILISGSTSGPVKRLLKFRFAEKTPAPATVQPPQITYMSIKSK